jgi:hypothetical protein
MPLFSQMQCVQAETAAKKALQVLATPQNQPTSTTSTKEDVGGNHSIFCRAISSNTLAVSIILAVVFRLHNSDVRASHMLSAFETTWSR